MSLNQIHKSSDRKSYLNARVENLIVDGNITNNGGDYSGTLNFTGSGANFANIPYKAVKIGSIVHLTLNPLGTQAFVGPASVITSDVLPNELLPADLSNIRGLKNTIVQENGADANGYCYINVQGRITFSLGIFGNFTAGNIGTEEPVILTYDQAKVF